MRKTFLLSLAIAASAVFIFFNPVQAAVPTLSLSSLDSDNVQVTVNGDADAPIFLFFYKTDGTTLMSRIGTTNASGYYSGSISSSNLAISPESIVHVIVNNQNSAQKTWPIGNSNGTSGGALSLSQTGVVMKVANSLNLSVYNAGTQSLYLLNNSNPQIVNVNINSNSQVNLVANTYGQTVVTVCALGTTSNCASVYVTVQNASAQALTFSQSTLTIAYGQSSTVSILNGSGAYTIVNNSNPSVIQSSLSASTITLTANNNAGSASLTVCSADMSACGIINASAGTSNSASLSFSQSSPTVYIGQSQNITISGGSNYNISSNSNSNILNASISGSSLVLNGNQAGSSTITVCASNGNCASLTATVSLATAGGALTLSQTSLWLQIGQAVSVVISGGSTPYSLGVNSGIFSSSLNNNILTLTGVAAGSGTLDVCSAGGACVSLSVLVNGVATNTQLTFSNNNLSLTPAAQTSVSLFGNGGYYVSNSTNQNVATVTVTDSTAAVKAISAGSANATICQTGGQCSVLYISVVSNTTNNPPVFSQNNPEIMSSQILNITLSGSDNNTYFIASNSNPTIVNASISAATLSLQGLTTGSSVLSICSATNNCSSLAVKVVNATTTPTTPTTPVTTPSNADNTLELIALESGYVAGGNADIIAGNAKITRDTTAETKSENTYLAPLLKNFSLSTKSSNTINYFIWYGTPATKKLGAGERAGVVSSYLQAYGKLPQTVAEWSDVLKIAQGRWPSELNAKAETQAQLEFKKVYNRSAVMSNNKDANAITIIAYGLRPTNRNTNSEKAAIISFRYVYAHDPVNPLAWNIVRAIAYSGTSR
ncbi:MAG: hypothetical protein PHE20_01705 [Patescibacteria group bacterium]|nr:hypothetical protein [Patescibacteria group bacterium]